MYPNYVHKVSKSVDCLQKVSIHQEFIGHVFDTLIKYAINVTKKCPNQQLSVVIHLQKISPKKFKSFCDFVHILDIFFGDE